MSEDNKPVIEAEEEVSQEITQGGNIARPRRGRPPKPKATTPNEVEALFQELIDTMEEAPDPVERSLDEIVSYNKKIIGMVQNILIQDLKTISPQNTARISTPNGIQKIEIGGLIPSTRDYLLKTLEQCFKAVALVEKDSQKDVGDDRLKQLANSLYKGIPGLDGTKPKT